MKQLFKTILVAGMFIFAVASPVMALATPQTASAAVTNCEARVLGIPPWYRGLTNNNPPTCDLKSPDDVGGIGTFIWRIVLNGVEMAIVIVAYIAVFFLLYGGFLYLTGGALPGQIEKARKTITNAVIGLVIAMAAIALNNLVFSIIT
jgi:hypothetical protein